MQVVPGGLVHVLKMIEWVNLSFLMVLQWLVTT
jgi:hypothetical protein